MALERSKPKDITWIGKIGYDYLYMRNIGLSFHYMIINKIEKVIQNSGKPSEGKEHSFYCGSLFVVIMDDYRFIRRPLPVVGTCKVRDLICCSLYLVNKR